MRYLVIALSLILAAQSVSAQQVSHVAEPIEHATTSGSFHSHQGFPLHFDRLTLDDGLSASLVTDVVQDEEGYIWIATVGGIDRYDGYEFTHYRADVFDSTALSTNEVWSLFSASDGTVWAGTAEGLHRYDRMRDQFERVPLSTPGRSSDRLAYRNGLAIRGMAEDPDGRLWIATRLDGVIRLDPETGQQEWFRYDPSDPASLCSDRIFLPMVDRSGTVWIPTSNGLCRFRGEGKGFERLLHDTTQVNSRDIRRSATSTAVTSVAESPHEKGILWMWSARGLHRLNMSTKDERLVRPSSAGERGAASVLPDVVDPGVLWIGQSGGGLLRFDSKSGEAVRYRHDSDRENSLPANLIVSLSKDRHGLIWAATFDGIGRFDPNGGVFRHLGSGSGGPLPDEYVRSVLEDQRGYLWVGTTGGALTRIDREQGRYKRWQLGGRGAMIGVQALYEDAEGVLWVGSTRGLHRYDAEEEAFDVFHYYEDMPSNNTVQRIGADAEGTLWVRLAGRDLREDLFRFDPEREVLVRDEFDPDPAENHPAFMVPLGLDQSGREWWNVETGLAVIEPDTVRYFHHDREDPESLGRAYVSNIVERSGEPDVMWGATHGGGLNRIDVQTGEVSRFTAEDGLPDERLYDVQPGDDGELWISSDRGLIQFDPSDTTFTTYGPGDGVQSWEFISWASFRSDSGELFFGGREGVTAFFPTDIRSDSQPPQVTLTELRLFDEVMRPGEEGPLDTVLAATEEVRLGPEQDVVTIGFVPLHFRNPSSNEVVYQLDGFDDGWREAGREHKATYTDLPPGEYTFRVKAANADGVWSEPRGVKLTMLPPWWRTPWAYALYVLLFVGLVLAVDRVRRRQVLRRERQRARLREARMEAESAEERSRILREVDELKTRFFANISHEFRTPLTLILGAAEKIADRDREIAETGTIRRNVQRLLELITQLLDLSRIEAGRMEIDPVPGDLAAFATEQVRDFTPLAERQGITLRLQCGEATVPVRFDPDAMQKIVANLLSNALKFTPEGGKVWVLVRRLEENETQEPTAELIVRDTGPGIPKEALPHLFDRFYQADGSSTRKQEGAGIGLALAHEMAELHGGSLTVETEEGFGSAFHLRLPLAPEADVAILEEAAMGSAARPAREGDAVPGELEVAASGTNGPSNAPGVLVVDDNPEVRALVRDYLQESCQVQEASDGAEALERARQNVPDLVVSDVMMPEIDGFELCRRLRADDDLKHVPVILLTARAEEADHAAGMDEGADAYLTKPFAKEVLQATARRLLERATGGERIVRLEPGEVEAQSDEEQLLQRILDIADAHLGDEHFTVGRLADEVGLSKRQLTRRLKDATGETPGKMLRRLRLERARQLLSKRATVAEVAYEVGYNSPSHFGRAFRSQFGMTPTEAAEAGEDVEN